MSHTVLVLYRQPFKDQLYNKLPCLFQCKSHFLIINEIRMAVVPKETNNETHTLIHRSGKMIVI
jgi:hypothetical protein